MKRIVSAAIAIILLVSLCSCQFISDLIPGKGEEYNSLPCTKDGIEEFLALGELRGEGLFEGLEINRDNLFNVTPEAVSYKTDYKIFKASDSCASFILIDNEIFPICESFGGYGFVNAVPWDYDDDGVTDLLVASSWGSGIHISTISLFNAKTKESTVIYTTSPENEERIDLIVSTQTPSFSSVDIKELPVYYVVYSVEIKVNDGNLANLSYNMNDVVGSIVYENNELIFKPTEKQKAS